MSYAPRKHTTADQYERYVQYGLLLKERSDAATTDDERRELITEIKRTIQSMPVAQFLDVTTALFGLVDMLTSQIGTGAAR